MPRSIALSHAGGSPATRIAFKPDIDVARNLQKVQQITGLDTDTLLNWMVFSPLEQIVDGDTFALFRMFISPQRFDTKALALVIIGNYERFVSELQAAGDHCHHYHAKTVLGKDGRWKIMFKSTHPLDRGAKYE